MHTGRQSSPDRGSFVSSGAGRSLTPVVARALELGQGPPGLIRWLNGQGAKPGPRADAADVVRLAAELGRVVRQAGVAETRVD